MIPTTTERVPSHTADHVNEQIRKQTLANVARYSQAGSAAIDRRLRELDEEWDIERLLEANAASIVVLGTLLGFGVDKRFFLIPGIVGTFLLQHAIQGWCPPVPLFRRYGVRTQTEIDEERTALKALRGDFKHAGAGPSGDRAGRALNAARA
jgi:hypothetical protein